MSCDHSCPNTTTPNLPSAPSTTLLPHHQLGLGSRLLQRFCVREVLGLDDSQFEIGRTKQNKPYLVHSPAVKAAAMARGIENFNFNVSHHGAVVVIVCDPLCVVSQTNTVPSAAAFAVSFSLSFFLFSTTSIHSFNSFIHLFLQYTCAQVGVDVMCETERPPNCTVSEFFSSFETNYTRKEWATIKVNVVIWVGWIGWWIGGWQGGW